MLHLSAGKNAWRFGHGELSADATANELPATGGVLEALTASLPDEKRSCATTVSTDPAVLTVVDSEQVEMDEHVASVRQEVAAMATADLYDHFAKACSGGDLMLVREFLSLTGARRVNVHGLDEYAFRMTCQNGHLDVVRELLALAGDREIDVHAGRDDAVRKAASTGQLGVVRELLALAGDRRIDVHAECDHILRLAAGGGQLDVMLALLALTGDRRVDVHPGNDFCLRRACEIGRLDMALELLALEGDRTAHIVHDTLPEAGRDMLASGLGDPNSPTVAAAWRAISSPDGMMMHPGVEYHTRESARAGYRVYKWYVRGVVVLRRQEQEPHAALGGQ